MSLTAAVEQRRKAQGRVNKFTVSLKPNPVPVHLLKRSQKSRRKEPFYMVKLTNCDVSELQTTA